ncbi:two-component sensor histidine kinase [Streptomyces sp. IMTB 2501]|uniref:sensor histidine kinase n=1 Tax=Streptomyces sp. IMTB 2501 TaxID=1776340 RepID=UPI00096DAAB5|nr:histidine kinase [Streptomyces sp. IMTB 2501]OLZ63040.1 two-component sensor histidine kinase [Streptomyces sp. IMTB 2501]
MNAQVNTLPRAAQHWLADRPRLTDALWAGGLTLLDMVTVLDRTPRPPGWGVALWGAQTVPLLWRRTRPRTVLVAMTMLYVLFQTLGPIHGKIPGPFLLMIGVYAVARYAPASASGPLTLLCLATTAVTDALTGHWQPPSPGSLEPISVTTFVFFFAVAWLLGYGRRRIGADAERLRELNRRLVAEQELNARQAVLTERARIARDLHDVVAHHVSAIALQARAAEDVLTCDPPDAGEAAHSVGLIAGTADTALIEMRRLLGLLSFDERELAPEPSLDHLDLLVGVATTAGCRVTYVSEARTGNALPAGMQVSAYRVVQEALTNVVKHAGPVGVRITVRGDEARLTVEVENDAPAPGHRPVPGAGRGLVGMRERVAAFDGELHAGPHQDGGWRLRAVLSARDPGTAQGDG